MFQPWLTMPVVYLDCEGDSLRELSALYVSDEFVILDIFHGVANEIYPYKDWYCRRYIHGIPRKVRTACAHPDIVIEKFKRWLARRPYTVIYANDCRLEQKLLQLPMVDLRLLPWEERAFHPSHRLAVLAKHLDWGICGKHCHYHTNYRRWLPKRSPPTMGDVARSMFSHHCALYDALELFLYDKYNKTPSLY